ncbi:RNA exonuclease 4-like [Lineus longissimus]|uniref:RNA exonuclease 4-like n=1 Tax=Lineus longissimus TaxID=88925 RepID=UPI00315C5DD6
MGQKRKATDQAQQSAAPFKKYKPSNAKTGRKGRNKWKADALAEQTKNSKKPVRLVEETLKRSKPVKKKKMAAVESPDNSSEQDWSKVVRKRSKRKRTTSGSALGPLGVNTPNTSLTEPEKPLPSKGVPPATSHVIAKHRNRVKKRKKILENQKSPVKAVTEKLKSPAGELKVKNVLTERRETVTSVVEKAERLHLPDKPEEVSSNWKQLQMTLPKPAMTSARPKSKTQPHSAKDRGKVKAKKEEKEPEIWFDDVDDILIDSLKTKALIQSKSSTQKDPLVKQGSFKGVTKVVAMDCEMVGVGADGKDSMLARVSIVNQFGQCIYDKYLQPQEDVTDYRTHVSGIRPADMVKGEEFSKVQKDVHDILKGRMLVGHALHNDFKVLFLDHPRKKIRDTARFKPFRKLFGGANPSLKKLCDKVLGVKVQEGEHNSIQDAQAAMRLYTTHKKQWERDIKTMTKGVPNAVLSRNRSPTSNSETVKK